jgi:hypothetical protein
VYHGFCHRREIDLWENMSLFKGRVFFFVTGRKAKLGENTIKNGKI